MSTHVGVNNNNNGPGGRMTLEDAKRRIEGLPMPNWAVIGEAATKVNSDNVVSRSKAKNGQRITYNKYNTSSYRSKLLTYKDVQDRLKILHGYNAKDITALKIVMRNAVVKEKADRKEKRQQNGGNVLSGYARVSKIVMTKNQTEYQNFKADLENSANRDDPNKRKICAKIWRYISKEGLRRVRDLYEEKRRLDPLVTYDSIVADEIYQKWNPNVQSFHRLYVRFSNLEVAGFNNNNNFNQQLDIEPLDIGRPM